MTPVLPPAPLQILRAIVLGLVLQHRTSGWAFGEAKSERVDNSLVHLLLDQGYLTLVGDTAEITEAGREILWNRTSDLVRKSLACSGRPPP